MVAYLRAANVKDGSLDLSDVKSMDFNPLEQAAYALRVGDVLVTEGAGSLAAVGASAVWSGEIEGVVCFQNTLLRLRPRGDTDARYLMWWVRHAYGSGLLASVAQGANIYHLGAGSVRLLPASMPDQADQRTIADYLEAETARIDALARRRELMIGLFKEQQEAKLTDILGDWQKVATLSLRQLRTKVVTGPFGTQLGAFEYEEGGVPVINPIHIRDGRFSPDPQVAVPAGVARRLVRHRLEVGDIVMGRKGDVGRAALVGPEEAGWICGSDSIAIRTTAASLLPEFLSLVLQSGYFRQQLEARSTGAMVASVNESTLLAFRVPDVSVNRQRRVLQAGRDAQRSRARMVDVLRRQLERLEERRQAVITAAVTGKLGIPGVAS